jgi:hypothetical protein
MFERHEVHVVPNGRRDDLWRQVWDWWARQGFRLSKTGPYRFHGSSFQSNIGLRREFDLALSEEQNGTVIDLSISAKLTDEGLVLGAVAAVAFLPVAVVGGALSYTQYETDAVNLTKGFWQYVDSLSRPVTARRVPASPQSCAGCGATMSPDWKVCPYCGRPRGPGGVSASSS